MTSHALPIHHQAAGSRDVAGPYLLFLGDTTESGYAKTAYGLRDWAPERCIGEFYCEGATVTTGLRFLTPAQAAAAGAKSMVIGVANAGGVVPESWLASLVQAMEAGLDIISGMHVRLGDIALLNATAARLGRRLIDVRQPPAGIKIASGRPRSGKRLLTVGTDCALGKKYTALALARAFNERGVHADFRASGQTGIMIAGSGIPLDAVVSDFAAGAAEMLSPDAAHDHWDVIEGQGSRVPPGLRGRLAGAAARQPGGRDRGLPPARARARARPFGLSPAEYRRNHRADPAPGQPHAAGHPLRRRQPEHLAPRQGGSRSLAGVGERTPGLRGRRSHAWRRIASSDWSRIAWREPAADLVPALPAARVWRSRPW